MRIRLDIGCGYNRKKGFVGIDANPHCKPDILLDVTKKKLPFRGNEVDEINCDNLLEHLAESEIEFIMTEFHRVIKEHGKIMIKVPYKTSASAYYWRHKTFVGLFAFQDYDIKLYNTSFQIRHLPKFRFKRKLEFHRAFFWNYLFELIFNLPKINFIYDTTGLCHIFPAEVVVMELRKVR